MFFMAGTNDVYDISACCSDRLRLVDLLLEVGLLDAHPGVAPDELAVDAAQQHAVGASVLRVHVQLDPAALVDLEDRGPEVLPDLPPLVRRGDDEPDADLVNLEVVRVQLADAVLLGLLGLGVRPPLGRGPRRPPRGGHGALHVQIDTDEAVDLDQDAGLVALERRLSHVAAGQVHHLPELLDVRGLEVRLGVRGIREEPLALHLELVGLVEGDAEAARPLLADDEGPAAHRIRHLLRPRGGGAGGRLARRAIGPRGGGGLGGGRGGCAAECGHDGVTPSSVK